MHQSGFLCRVYSLVVGLIRAPRHPTRHNPEVGIMQVERNRFAVVSALTFQGNS